MLKLFLTDRFREAFDFAFQKHRNQLRKGSGVPYLTHLMSVSALVGEYGGGEDEMIAALLHDSIEDVGVSYEEIRIRFGDRVADIVQGCTKEKVDWKSVPKEQVWLKMRDGHLKYFEHLRSTFPSVRLVSACDKLHNARHVLADLQAGRDIFAKMKGGPGGTVWYYERLGEVFTKHGNHELGRQITVTALTIRDNFVRQADCLLEDGSPK